MRYWSRTATIVSTTIATRSLVTQAALALGKVNKELATASMMTVPVTELMLPCSDGVHVAGQSWRVTTGGSGDNSTGGGGRPRRRNILCLHGWLDNCRSFHFLGPELATQLAHASSSSTMQYNGQNNGNSAAGAAESIDVHVVALDFPGHGMSSHKSLDGPSILLSESAFYVAEAIQKLGWWNDDNNNKKNNNNNGAENNEPFTLIGHSMGAGTCFCFCRFFLVVVFLFCRDVAFLDNSHSHIILSFFAFFTGKQR